MEFTRYGVYFTPGDTAFAGAGATWLGWDIRSASARTAPFPQYVARPRKYGFHATLKPPFRLASGQSLQALKDATEQLAGSLAPVQLGALELSRIGSFFAFTPQVPSTPLKELSATVVSKLDVFRAAPGEDEIAKRRTPGMTDDQIQNLNKWGYAYVMDSFRFHMTLSSPILRNEATSCSKQIEKHFARTLPEPFVLDALTLVGERRDGNFCELTRHLLG